MICEKCNKIVGNYVETKKGEKTRIFCEEVIICPKCKAIFCKKCANEMTECENCGTKIKK